MSQREEELPITISQAHTHDYNGTVEPFDLYTNDGRVCYDAVSIQSSIPNPKTTIYWDYCQRSYIFPAWTLGG